MDGGMDTYMHTYTHNTCMCNYDKTLPYLENWSLKLKKKSCYYEVGEKQHLELVFQSLCNRKGNVFDY